MGKERTSEAIREINESDLKEMKGLAIVEIYKPGCEPCEELQETLKEVRGDYSQKLDFYKAHFASSRLGTRFNINVSYLPVVVVLKDGKMVDTFAGAKYARGIGSERSGADSAYIRKRLDRVLIQHSSLVLTEDSEIGPVIPRDLESKLLLSENSLVTLRERYLKRNDRGEVIEKPEDMFHRVAYNISEADAKYGKSPEEVEITANNFYEMMTRLEFLPNSPTLMNAGRDLQQLSGCFVLPIEDSIYSIFKAAGEGALVHKSGGGTGFSFSNLRPKNSVVRSTSGVASGPTSFIYAFNVYTETVKQGGTRRGANMGVLRIDHPDIREFIHAKGELNSTNYEIVERLKKEFGLGEDDLKIVKLKRILMEKTQLNNFNLSVGMTREFMSAIQKDDYFDLRDPRTRTVIERVKARELLEEIVDQAWKSGDPGVIFLDNLNEGNPTPHIGEYETTNPCGEQPLLPYESCNLGSINLFRFVKNGEIDWNGLKKTVHTAVHFLDNVIDMNEYPLPEIREKTLNNRKIGLGVMGFFDMLTMLKIPYNSSRGAEIAEGVMKFIREEARIASIKLAEERGTFPNWKGSVYDPESEHFKGKNLKLRNATLTTIAPTGTLAQIANCEWGIEPPFHLAYTKTVLDGRVLKYHIRGLENVLRDGGYDAEGIFRELEEGKREKFNQLPEEIKRLGITSMDLTPEDHIRIQAAFQKHTDNAVSKTINFPSNATREDVKKAILYAYQEGCKGITIYRNLSKDVQVLNVKKENEFDFGSKTPKEVLSITRDEVVGDGKRIFVTTSYFENDRNRQEIERLRREGRPTQVFVDANFFNPDTQALITALAIRCSKDLRAGISPEEIIQDLKDLPPSAEQGIDTGFGPDREYVNRSIPDAMSKALAGWAPPNSKSDKKTEKEKKSEIEKGDSNKYGFCDACSRYGIVRLEGCDKCLHCGASKKGCS